MGVTLKIEATLHLIGRIGAENLGELLALVRKLWPPVRDQIEGNGTEHPDAQESARDLPPADDSSESI